MNRDIGRIGFQDDTARLIAKAHERLVGNPPWLYILHDLNPRAFSRRVQDFVSPQCWFVDLTPVDLQ